MARVTIADSFSGIVGEPAAVCSRCGTTARLTAGACLSCLLGTGLEVEEGEISESFQSAISAIDVPDSESFGGKYQTLRETGLGGTGVIYRARQRHSHRIVALKRVLGYHGASHDT